MITVRQVSNQEMSGLIFSKLGPSVSDEAKEVLVKSVHNSSLIWLGEKGDEILCFYGLISPSFLSDQAYLWLYTTPALEGNTFVLIRHSQRAVREMLKVYPRIVGHGRAGAERSLAWLRLIGAKFGEPQGELIPFEIGATQ